METRKLGRTDIEVTALGFGGGPLGNLYHAISDEDAELTIAAAYEAGMRYFDTAPFYGLGLSERRIGNALRERSDVVLSTKVGRLLTADSRLCCDKARYGFANPLPFAVVYDYSYDGILRSVEDSLQRLGMARIDIALVHDIGRVTHGDRDNHYFDQLHRGGGYRALEALRDAGTVSAIGLGVNEAEICERCMDIGQWDAFMLAGRYTLLEQDCLDGLMQRCVNEGTSILLGGPYNSGILATGIVCETIPYYNYVAAPPEIVAKVRQLQAICTAHGLALPAAALQFPLAHPAVASVVPGLGKPARVAETAKLMEVAIPSAFWSDLKAEGLLHPGAPVPVGEQQ